MLPTGRAAPQLYLVLRREFIVQPHSRPSILVFPMNATAQLPVSSPALPRRSLETALAVLLAVSIALVFWSQQRYPALLKKMHSGTAIQVKGAISFDALLKTTPQMPLPQRVLRTGVTWRLHQLRHAHRSKPADRGREHPPDGRRHDQLALVQSGSPGNGVRFVSAADRPGPGDRAAAAPARPAPAGSREPPHGPPADHSLRSSTASAAAVRLRYGLIPEPASPDPGHASLDGPRRVHRRGPSREARSE